MCQHPARERVGPDEEPALYLKSLTLQGFKSFASSTTLQLEPGITCVVGPNGSGKSNVVDALAWVMGEQGAKCLRGGKMEDVIFAGTSGRPPLGRAEVLLTIDNSDGALPIDYAEVTITGPCSASGGSEYAINGTPCRLLDVQELLSDSGIGREMHVIVGQGQLDAILHATPEDRRGFIEEAAGVLKHRKRKEKALRKLDATEGNLHPAAGPAHRDPPPAQAAGAAGRGRAPGGRRAGRRPRRPGRGCWPTTSPPRGAPCSRSWPTRRCWSSARESEVEAAIAEAQQQEARAGGGAARAAPRAVPRPGHLVRAVGAAGAAARHRSRSPPSGCATPAAWSRSVESGRDPDQLEAEAAQVREQEQVIETEVAGRRTALEDAVAARRAAEDAAAEEERRVAGLQRAAADRREGLARLHGQVNALKSRAAAAADEVGRLAQAREEAEARAARAQRDFTSPRDPDRRAATPARRTSTPSTRARAPSSTTSTSGWPRRGRRCSRPSASGPSLLARKDALEIGLARKDGAGALLAATDDVSGLLGSVAALLSVRSGYETAVAAALGSAGRRRRGGRRRRRGRRDATPPGRRPGPRRAAARRLAPTSRPRLARPAGRGDVRRRRRRRARRPRGRADAGCCTSASWSTTSPPRARWSPRPRPDGGHPRRRRRSAPTSPRGGSATPAEPDRGAGGRRRGDVPAGRGHRDRRAARLRHLAARGRAARAPSSASTCALAKLHESDATLAAVAEQLGQFGSQARCGPRRGGAARHRDRSRAEEARDTRPRRSRRPRGAARPRRGRPPTRSPTPPPVSGSPRRPARPGRARWTRGSRCARPRSAPARLHGRADQLVRAAQAEREARVRAAERRERLLREGAGGRGRRPRASASSCSGSRSRCTGRRGGAVGGRGGPRRA